MSKKLNFIKSAILFTYVISVILIITLSDVLYSKTADEGTDALWDKGYAVLPTPQGPVRRNACGIRPEARIR